MENTIKTIFYNYKEDYINKIGGELNNIGYKLEYEIVNDLSIIKSEIMKSGWDIVVFDKKETSATLEEILDFITDINSKVRLLISIEKLDSSLIQLILKNRNSDIILKTDLNQTCLALIRTQEKLNEIKQFDFTKKELMRSQQSQIEHEHFLNQVIESTTNPIFYKGTNGRYLGCNKAFARYLGLEKEDIIGRNVFDISPKEFAQKYFEMDQAFFKDPKTQQYEYRAEHADGHQMDVIFYKTAIHDDDNNVVGLLGHMFDISDRKKLEQEVYREKEAAELILDTANKMYIMLDLEGNITSINNKASEILQYEKSTILGKNWFQEFILKDDRESVRKVFQHILEGNSIKEEKVKGRVVTSLKETRIILWTNRAIKNVEGEIIGTLSSGEDITNKNNLELDLEESQRKYKSLVDNMQEGLSIVDLDENILFCNPAFDKIFGFESGGMVGKNLKDYVQSQDHSNMVRETNKRKENKTSQYKIGIIRKDNKNRILSISSTPWKNSDGKVVGAIGLIMDITAQEYSTKRLEKKIQLEHSIINISSQFISPENFHIKLDNTLNELKNIIEAERYGVFTVHNNNLKLTNRKFFDGIEGFGIDLEDIPYHKFKYSLGILESFDFIFYDDIDSLPLEASPEKELLQRFKIHNFLAIPFYSELELSGLLIISNIFEVNDWNVEDLSMLRTITEIIGHTISRNKAEKKVKQLNLDLITKNKELEQIVYVTSHDIRSPVVNILGFSDEMMKALNKLAVKIFDESNTISNSEDIKFLLEKDVPQILNFIKVSGQKIDKLLFALLKLSRLGRAAINKVDVDMNQLVKTVLSTFEYKIKQENVVVNIEPLPNCYSDEVSINQVFSNLIDNSIKYGDPSRETHINISATESDDNVTYCISDNGIGICETEMGKIFDVFYRINPDNQQGDGIGLSLIKKTIDRLNGKIYVGSEIDKGTKFYITLEKQEN
ncbi:MAG: PAS domain S-box protein [Bacteroidales bacterium]|nr:PAS domain S-box protein [Bacteroidales bacterium]